MKFRLEIFAKFGKRQSSGIAWKRKSENRWFWQQI